MLTTWSELRGDGLRESACRPRGETLCDGGERSPRLPLSGLSSREGGDLRGIGLLRGL